MKKVLVWMILGCSGVLPLSAAEPAKAKPSSSKKGAPAKPATKSAAKAASTPAPSPAVTPAPAVAATATSTPQAIPVAPPERKLELFLLLPMPKIVGTASARSVGGSVSTVFCPAREISRPPYIEVYTDEEFTKLGISADAFEKKAREAAERLITAYRPELIKDESGRIRYGVYRGEKEIFACLMLAPSLGKVFENVFGKEIIVAMPDRNALYVFPPNPAVVDDFAADMESRYEVSFNAASDEVFVIKAETGEIRALGSFSSR